MPRQSSKKKKKKGIKNHEENSRNILNNIKCNNICIMGIPEGEESEQGNENMFEYITTENFLIW